MKKYILIAVVALLVLSTALMAVTPVSADGDDYANNPGLAKASPSGQTHGAFEYFKGNHGDLWVPDAAKQGGIGDTTGPANSAGAPWGGQNSP